MVPAHFFVGSDDAPHLGVVIHGALGAGHNFRSFIKRLTEERPEYRFVLIDLRHHGLSQGAPPPHTLESCVDDLLDLLEEQNLQPELIIGHSLGGKIALQAGKRYVDPGAERPMPPAARKNLRQVWALDSDPGAQTPGDSHQVLQVLRALQKHPGPFNSRKEATDNILQEGFSSGLANWLSTNLERKESSYTWRLQLDAISELLEDYFRTDLWDFLESWPAQAASTLPELSFHLLVAENSDRWSGSMRERAEQLPPSPQLLFHELAEAGHWVHVDNPQGLLEILKQHLP